MSEKLLERVLRHLEGSNPNNISGGIRNAHLREEIRIALFDARKVAAADVDGLCSDCPRVGHSTDSTRCIPCTRRSQPPLHQENLHEVRA